MVCADAGPKAGLGHLSRSGAVLVALRGRGIFAEPCALGVESPFERDGVAWTPAAGVTEAYGASPGAALFLDSYSALQHADARAIDPPVLAVMHDYGAVNESADLVVTISRQISAPTAGSATYLAGPEYACVRPAFWGVPPAVIRSTVERILVTTGAGDLALPAGGVADVVSRATDSTKVQAVVGPYGSSSAPPGVDRITSPPSLLRPLLHADIAVTAGGQTMLEAAAVGTPCLVLPMVENQRPQVSELAAGGAVEQTSMDLLESRVRGLAADVDERRRLSRNAQRMIDGYGALRVAFTLDCMLRRSR